MRNLFQAVPGISYPTVPANWPNRAIRRAVKLRRESRLPGEWGQFLMMDPSMRTSILKSRA